MTLVYVPTLIESVEQAEKLPDGTIAQCVSSDGTVSHACLRVEGGWWCTNELVRGEQYLVPHAGMVGDTALVPVEAKEQWQASWPADDAHLRCRDEPTARFWAEKQGAVPMSRLVTPWEPAP